MTTNTPLGHLEGMGVRFLRALRERREAIVAPAKPGSDIYFPYIGAEDCRSMGDSHSLVYYDADLLSSLLD